MKLRQKIALVVLALLVLWGASATVAKADTVSFEINVDNQLVRDMENAISLASAQHPEVGDFTVELRQLPPQTYAGSTRFGNIAVSAYYAYNPDMWKDQFEWDQASYFHGHSCTSPGSYVGFHEMAHLISRAHGSDAPAHAEATFGTGNGLPLTGYSFNKDGTVFWEEALAEAYAETMCGHPSELEKQLTYILENS